MRILVVQESDWVEVGPHDTHHLLERLSTDGNQVRVIDHQIRWGKTEQSSIYSRRKVREHYQKAIPEGNITVITPAFVRAPLVDYISIVFSHYLEIRRQVDSFNPDVIIGLGISNSFIASKIAKQKKIPFVYYVLDELHQLVPQKYLRSLAKIIERDNQEHANLVIATNNNLRDYCILMGANENCTTILRHGVDLNRYSNANGAEIRSQLGLVDNDIVLFFMGWLYSFSGLDVVARSIVDSDDPHVKLLILGNGELWDTLMDIQKEDKIGGRIITVGWKTFSEVPNYVAAADICLLPAMNNRIMENIVPIKVIEYMAAKKPVIATELPGLVKEFGTDNGIIFIKDPGETVPVAKRLSAKHSMLMHGQRAQDAVRENDWEALVPKFKDLLMNLSAD